MPRICWVVLVATGCLSLAGAEARAAERCESREAEIVTDRPDVTNSSLVVPRGSLQLESGANWTARPDASALDGPNLRLRLGAGSCTEVLLDLPDYVRAWRGHWGSGFSDLSPAVKRQLGPIFGDFQLSVTAGIQVPSGASRIAGRGYGGYLQLPWSKEIAEGWGVSGMVSSFWLPGRASNNPMLEPTFVVEREIGERAAAFIEYVADQPRHGAFSHMLNSGAVYRVTPRQQLDFHIGFGLNRQAPSYFFGLGYSFRLDDLF